MDAFTVNTENFYDRLERIQERETEEPIEAPLDKQILSYEESMDVFLGLSKSNGLTRSEKVIEALRVLSRINTVAKMEKDKLIKNNIDQQINK